MHPVWQRNIRFIIPNSLLLWQALLHMTEFINDSPTLGNGAVYLFPPIKPIFHMYYCPLFIQGGTMGWSHTFVSGHHGVISPLSLGMMGRSHLYLWAPNLATYNASITARPNQQIMFPLCTLPTMLSQGHPTVGWGCIDSSPLPLVDYQFHVHQHWISMGLCITCPIYFNAIQLIQYALETHRPLPFSWDPHPCYCVLCHYQCLVAHLSAGTILNWSMPSLQQLHWGILAWCYYISSQYMHHNLLNLYALTQCLGRGLEDSWTQTSDWACISGNDGWGVYISAGPILCRDFQSILGNYVSFFS